MGSICQNTVSTWNGFFKVSIFGAKFYPESYFCLALSFWRILMHRNISCLSGWRTQALWWNFFRCFCNSKKTILACYLAFSGALTWNDTIGQCIPKLAKLFQQRRVGLYNVLFLKKSFTVPKMANNITKLVRQHLVIK